MPVASIEDGTQFYYEDSGPPYGSTTYTTLVLVHATAFHGGIFKRLFSFAPKCDMRIVSINLRDYPGSTPYSSDELAELRSADPNDQASFMRCRGVELAMFLVWFIEHKNIPSRSRFPEDGSSFRTTSDGYCGGLGILGWSSGNCMTISLFAHSRYIPRRTKEVLNAYIRTCIIFDPTLYSLGITAPPLNDLPSPIRDPSVPSSEAAEAFAIWVSSYYSHTSITTPPLASLSHHQILSKIAKVPIDTPAPHQRPTLTRMTTEDLRSVTDFERTARTHLDIINVHGTVYGDNARRLLLGADVWPHLRVEFVWCDMAVGDCIFAAWNFAQMTARLRGRGTVRRPVRMSILHNANHFPHWDLPEETVDLLSKII